MHQSDKLSKLKKFILSHPLEGYYYHEEMAENREAVTRRLSVPKDPADLEQVYNPRRGGTLYLHLDCNSVLNPRSWPHLHAKRILIAYFGFVKQLLQPNSKTRYQLLIRLRILSVKTSSLVTAYGEVIGWLSDQYGWTMDVAVREFDANPQGRIADYQAARGIVRGTYKSDPATDAEIAAQRELQATKDAQEQRDRRQHIDDIRRQGVLDAQAAGQQNHKEEVKQATIAAQQQGIIPTNDQAEQLTRQTIAVRDGQQWSQDIPLHTYIPLHMTGRTVAGQPEWSTMYLSTEHRKPSPSGGITVTNDQITVTGHGNKITSLIGSGQVIHSFTENVELD
jgi:hypothetical protein